LESCAIEKNGHPFVKALWRRCAFISFVAVPVAFATVAASQLAPSAQTSGFTTQANVDQQNNNIPGDAANEPSLCVDPTNPDHIAVGWRQFPHVRDDARFAGWAYSTNGGLTWTFPGVLETNVFRSDPVLTASADGQFYYLSTLRFPYRTDLWTSTNHGATWTALGSALGGDKPWMTIDTTSSPGHGNLYQAWSPVENSYGDGLFSRSTDGGLNWSAPVSMPSQPYWGSLAVGSAGEVYVVGWNGGSFWVDRSTNAPDAKAAVKFDLTRLVNLGGSASVGITEINPEGLTGQPWIVVDHSNGPAQDNVYVLCSVQTADKRVQVMFSRSTDRGRTWSAPLRLNDDLNSLNSFHWFGTLAVAPNGRLDACWYDTRASADNSSSELYYSNSYDGGITWSPNRAISPPFNHQVGYPVQRKIGDYITMTALEDRTCIVYAGTFNVEEDIFFRRIDFPVLRTVAGSNGTVKLSWNSSPGTDYQVLFKDNLADPWRDLGNPVQATDRTVMIEDGSAAQAPHRFYRVMSQL
jgi:hypothetical protein